MPSAREREDSATEMKTANEYLLSDSGDELFTADGVLDLVRVQRCGKSVPAGSRGSG